MDFEEIQGQETVKRAAVIAAAGFHNFLISGPQGAGKTMIARRIPTILPRLSREESLEVSRIYSVAGLLSEEQPFMSARPFRHHITPLPLRLWPEAAGSQGRERSHFPTEGFFFWMRFLNFHIIP